MEKDWKYPDVYIISKFTSLPTDLKKYLPENVKVIPVNTSGKSFENSLVILMYRNYTV